jgi:hypothetical protein
METHPASAPPSQEESASWTDDDITALVDYLYQSRATIDDFKPKLFRKAAVHLEAMRTEGGVKDATNTGNKWNSVCLTISCCRSSLIVKVHPRSRLNGLLSIVFAAVQA